jgi:hypothetical protein
VRRVLREEPHRAGAVPQGKRIGLVLALSVRESDLQNGFSAVRQFSANCVAGGTRPIRLA